MTKFGASLASLFMIVIYYCNIFIIQASDGAIFEDGKPTSDGRERERGVEN
jgi:hypothetical protein